MFGVHAVEIRVSVLPPPSSLLWCGNTLKDAVILFTKSTKRLAMKVSSLALGILVVGPSSTVGFVPVPPAPINVAWTAPSVAISQTQPASAIVVDNLMLKSLEKETQAAEKEAKVDERKAKVEKSREAFFEYEAKMAAEQEARIEAAEEKALAEAQKDKEEDEKLKALEQKAELDFKLAQTKQERAAKQKEIRVSNRLL